MAPRAFFDYTDRATKGGGCIKDAAANLLVWNWWMLGNDTGVDWLLQNSAGQVVRTGRFDAATGINPDWKLDWVHAAQSGPDVFFTCGGHEAISSESRHNPVWGYVLPAVLVPFASNPGGGDPTLAQAYPPEQFAGVAQEPPPGGGGMTEADFQRIHQDMITEIDRLLGYYGETQAPKADRLRQGMENKSKDAAIELLTQDDAEGRGRSYRNALAAYLPPAMLAVLKDDAYFAQFNSMIGQTTAKILIELGVADPDTAPAWVKGLPGFPWGAGEPEA